MTHLKSMKPLKNLFVGVASTSYFGFVGSLSAAIFGWFVIDAILFLLPSTTGTKNYSGLILIAVFSGVIVFVTWIAILLPIFFLVPLRSLIWRWPVSTLIGGVSGWVIMSVFSYISSPHNGSVSSWMFFSLLNGYNWLGALCGAATGLFSGLIAQSFLRSSKQDA